MVRWSNAGLYQRSRESHGDMVCLFTAALSHSYTKISRHTLDLQRLSDATAREFGTGERRVSKKENAQTEWSAIDLSRGKDLSSTGSHSPTATQSRPC